MPQLLTESADVGNTFKDLSGVDIRAYSNPYDAVIEACENDSARIQEKYSTHRTTRNAQQRDALLAHDFPGMNLDNMLKKLEDPALEPKYVDPRHCVVFWARPPPHVQDLVSQIQARVRAIAPNIWLMPPPRLHITVLEVTHSLTAPDIPPIIAQLEPVITAMTDYPSTHPSRLIKPIVSYDRSAIALSFLPAADEGLPSASQSQSGTAKRSPQDDTYTYHHLRRDIFQLAKSTGTAIDSRYVVPSSHITIGRLITQDDHDSKEKMENYLKGIDDINAWLEKEFWPVEGRNNDKGEWIVGQGQGLLLRTGTLWYGGGETVRLGKGF